MIWLDFFLQALIHALAWCVAIAVVGGAVAGLILLSIGFYGRLPLRRDR